MTNQPVVREKDRQLNLVDMLMDQIKQIETTCEHDFKLLEPLILEKSSVSGVFLADTRDGRKTHNLVTKCLRCSMGRVFSLTEKCPMCLGQMIKTDRLENREEYHGVSHGYNRSRVYLCKDCSFNVVVDECDQ